jgi:diguanylate cyclase (GGDEF)-like protein
MLDVSRRLRPVEVILIVVLALLAGIVVPTSGPGLLAAVVLSAAVSWTLQSRASRQRHPEYHFIVVFAVAEVLIAAGIVVSSGPRILLVALLAIPTLLSGAAWPRRGVVAASVATALLMLAVAFIVDGSGVRHTPPLAIYPLAVLLSIVIVASAAQGADLTSRATAVVDRLTGLLNRAALLSRSDELAHQAVLTGEPVAVILGDVDHFKAVNDSLGHSQGDAILTGVAKRLRDALGSAESVYRFGGEEFVVLIPGANAAAGAASAEMLREAVGRTPIDGLAVTVSFGVAASGAHERFDFEALFGSADVALYMAKAQGRDRVWALDGAPGGAREGTAGPVAAPTPAGSAPTAELSERRASGRPGARVGAAPVLAEAPDEGRLAAHVARERAETGSWLVRDEAARSHMLDLLYRIRRVRIAAYGVVLLALLAAGPFYGWLPIAPPFAGAIVMAVVIELSSRRRRPEFAIGAVIVLSLVANAAGFLLCHGKPFVALPLLVIPLFAWSPVFPARGVAVAAAIDALLIAAAGVFIGHQALSDPLILGVPFALLVTVALIGAVLGRSSIDFRSAGVVDQLTGLLNRQALESRIAVVAQQVAYSGQQVAVLIGDIDHFKRINDRAGHRTGDAVLREIAYRMRKNLRAFEAAYRVGGEEFVIILTGTPTQEAAEIAERLRATIRSEPIEDLPVTMSFGVAASGESEPFDYALLFERADACLFEAKRAGRDRVRLAEDASRRHEPPVATAAVPVAT